MELIRIETTIKIISNLSNFSIYSNKFCGYSTPAKVIPFFFAPITFKATKQIENNIKFITPVHMQIS